MFFVENAGSSSLNLKDLSNVQTVSNLPVKVDKVLYDLTGTTFIGVTGVVTVKGIRIRGVWDANGRPLEFSKLLSLNIRYNMMDINTLFEGIPRDYFALVMAKPIESDE